MFGSLMSSSAALSKNMIVAHSSMLIVMRSRDPFCMYFRVTHTMESGPSMQHQKFSSEKCAPHLVRKASRRTVQS